MCNLNGHSSLPNDNLVLLGAAAAENLIHRKRDATKTIADDGWPVGQLYLSQLVSSLTVICREDKSYETVGDHARKAGILWSSFHWHRWQMLRRQPRISFTPHAFTKNAPVLCMLQRLILGLIQRKTEITLVSFIRWNQRTSRRNRLMRRSSSCRACKKTRYIWLSKKDRPKKRRRKTKGNIFRFSYVTKLNKRHFDRWFSIFPVNDCQTSMVSGRKIVTSNFFSSLLSSIATRVGDRHMIQDLGYTTDTLKLPT